MKQKLIEQLKNISLIPDNATKCRAIEYINKYYKNKKLKYLWHEFKNASWHLTFTSCVEEVNYTLYYNGTKLEIYTERIV